MSEEMNGQQEDIMTDGAPEEAKEDDMTQDKEEASGSEASEGAGGCGSEEESGDADSAEEGSGAEEDKCGSAKDKTSKKDPKDALIEELQDKYRRQMAEFDNFRKRSEKEKSAMYEIGARDIIEKILPVVDNFERGLESISEEEKATPFADGIEKIYKQLTKTLEDIGVKPIEALGREFDPDIHNAVMHVEDEEAGENIIVEEFQKGYTYRDNVVRHSMVKVAN